MRVPLLVATLCLGLAPAVSAQAGFPVQRGSVSLGGTAGLSSQSTGGDDRITVLALAPSALYFVADGLGIGGTVSYQGVHDGDEWGHFLGLGPRVAYYLGGPESRVYPYAQAGLFYTTSDQDIQSLGGDVAAGALVMLSRAVGLNAEAYYETQSVSFGGFQDQDRNAFGLRAGITAFVY